jgi:hypothetical protein
MLTIQRKTNGVHITWIQTPIKREVYFDLIVMFRKSKDYSRLTKEKIKKINQTAHNIFTKHNAEFREDTVLSLRSIAIKGMIVSRYSKLPQFIDKIASAYLTGGDILDLSYQFNYPPLNLLHGILLHLGYNARDLNMVFKHTVDHTKILTGEDLDQYERAEANDAESTFNQKLIAKIAAKNENLFVDYFKSAGIIIKTQDDLTIEQVGEFGRPVLTPDLLFMEDVYINDQLVKWIDFKDYTGTDIAFLYNSNKDQAKKYYNKWGNGAMCYRKGFIDSLDIPGAMLLDGSVIDVKYRDSYY